VNAGYVSHKVDDRHTRNAYAIIWRPMSWTSR